MDPNAFYMYGIEMPSSPFLDWVGVPESPSAPNLVLMDLEDAPATISSFDQDIDDALGDPYDAMAPLNFACQLDPVIDWQSVFNNTMPFPPPALTDDVSSITGSSNQPLSPASDSTLLDPPFPSYLQESRLSPPEDVLLDWPAAPSPLIFDDFAFTFEYDPTTTMPPFDPSAALLQQGRCYDDNYDYSQGQYWPGQQPSQHSVGAAGAVAPGLAMDVEVNVDAFAFTAMVPASPPLPVLSAEPQQDSIIANQKPKPVPFTRKRASPVDSDADSNYSPGESNTEGDVPTKRTRTQDKTKRFPCHYAGCDWAFSRTHNLHTHIKNVHLGKRSFPCKEPGCSRAFARKHDLERHHQSKHTNLGSPRNAKNPNNAKGAKDRKAAKQPSTMRRTRGV